METDNVGFYLHNSYRALVVEEIKMTNNFLSSVDSRSSLLHHSGLKINSEVSFAKNPGFFGIKECTTRSVTGGLPRCTKAC